jgi:hypothetical protein
MEHVSFHARNGMDKVEYILPDPNRLDSGIGQFLKFDGQLDCLVLRRFPGIGSVRHPVIVGCRPDRIDHDPLLLVFAFESLYPSIRFFVLF